MSQGNRACRACRRGCHEDATRKLLPWNLSLTTRGRETRGVVAATGYQASDGYVTYTAYV